MISVLKAIFSKSIIFCLILLSYSDCFAQVDCFPRNDDRNARSIVASHYSPYLGSIWITNISTIVLGASMPTNKEEIESNRGAYSILAFYGFLQWIGMQGIGCPSVGKRPAEDFYKIENIDANYYRSLQKYFWWSYGLNITAISYMASISEKEDRWNRVAGVVLAPWIFDLLVNRIFYPRTNISYMKRLFF